MKLPSMLFALAAAAGTVQAATFTVDTTVDLADVNPGDGVCLTSSGTCSLRAAIQEANATAALDTVAFAVPGAGVHTFQTASLPAIVFPIVIDGFTQPGSQANTNPTGGLNAVLNIELTGGLLLRGGDVTVRGVVANGGPLAFGGGPTPARSVLEGCYVGTDPTGTLPRSGGHGATFIVTFGPVQVGGALPAQRNLISSNQHGIDLFCGSAACPPGSFISGNLIGTNVAGTGAIPNAFGINIDMSGGMLVGGASPAQANVLSGNGVGIRVWRTGSWNVPVRVEGNFIGVDATGAVAVPNGTGVMTGTCVSPQGSCHQANLVVGGDPTRRNVIARNTGHGAWLLGAAHRITHNAITDNGGDGIHSDPAGAADQGEIADNLIAGNVGHAAWFRGSSQTTLARNTIRDNGGGVVLATVGPRVTITANAIVDNGGLGIDLLDDGVTPNDPLDPDTGPNDLMNHPVITYACSGAGGIAVGGTLNTRASTTATIELFRSPTCDVSGHGEGAVFSGPRGVATDPAGNAAFSFTLPAGGTGDFVTATATDANGQTSEFGACFRIDGPNQPPPPAQAITGPSGVCSGTSFALDAVPGAHSYQWFLNGTPIAGATGVRYAKASAVPADAGSYTVSATICGATAVSPPHALAVVSCSAFPVRLDVDRHAVAGSASDLNGVLEPSETAVIEPRYRNDFATALTLTGTAALGGPAGGTYALPDAAADYGSVPPGQLTDCFGATGNCYLGAVSAAVRPATHWDAAFTETTSGGDPARQWPLHVGASFTDVPRTNLFYRFIEAVLHNGVTGGCTASTYCPLSSATREQMAVFVLVAKEGAGYRPPDCNPSAPRFSDVPASSGFCRWIEELARRGVVAGCGGNNYCPAASVSREQMTVFVLATREAPGYSPPACVAGSEAFADVPASSPFCRWVEELARRGVVAGCGGGNFCPTVAITRGEMSVFLTGTFGLQLYGP